MLATVAGAPATSRAITLSNPSTSRQEVQTSISHEPEPNTNSSRTSRQHQPTRRQGVPTSTNFGRSQVAQVSYEYKAVANAMVSHVTDALSLQHSQRILLNRLVSVAMDTDDSFGGRAEVHVIVTINDPNLFDGRETIATVIFQATSSGF